MNPGENQIKKLHEKCAKNKETLDDVWTHSQIVKEIAVLICKGLEKKYQIKTDIELIKTGALVHDIGYYACFDKNFFRIKNKIRHGEIGYKILKKEKMSENIARFCLTHIGTGITKEHIQKQKLPLKKIDQIPITLEEEIVCYADIFHSKNPSEFNTFEYIKKKWKNISANEEIILNRFKLKFGIPNLKKLKEKYENNKY